MRLVIDASVAIKWYVAENLREAARQLVLGAHELHTVDLLGVELANIAWKKALRGEIGTQQATLFVDDRYRHFMRIHRSDEHLRPALQLALDLGHPVYDCIYLACAAGLDATLVTADRRLLDAVADTAYGRRAAYLADVAAQP